MAKLTNAEPGKDDPASLPPVGRRLLWADNPAAVNRAVTFLMVLCAILFVLDFIIHRHGHFSIEAIYGFYGIAGFVAFTVIVISAKVLRMIIGRDETYYSPRAVDGEAYPESGLAKLQHSDLTGNGTEDRS